MGECLNKRGSYLWENDRFEEAEREYRAAQALLERLFSEHPNNDEYADILGRNSKDLGETLYANRNIPREGEKYLRRAVELQERLVAKYASAPAVRLELAKSWLHLTILCHSEKRTEEAKHAARQATKVLESLPTTDLDDKFPKHVAFCQSGIAKRLFDLGEPAEARRLLDGAREKLVGDLGPDYPDPMDALRWLASACEYTGQMPQAV